MIYNDVQLFWAKDENNDIAIIYDLQEQDRHKKYTCPICDSEVKPVAIGGVTKDGKVAQVSGHFSHYDASKCSNETVIHYFFKEIMIVNRDSFIIKTDVEHEYICKEAYTEKIYKTEHGIYKPDLTIVTECGQTIYFEMNYSNKKKVKDYLDKWLELGNPVIEVNLKMLSEAKYYKTKYEFKTLFYEGKCFNNKRNDPYYDTVGQHKEKLYKNYTISEDIKNRLKKLDWFWLETINYKKGETNIEQLIDCIDYADQEDRELLFLILSKKRCVPIYEDYINYKVVLFEKLGNNFINNYCDGVYKDYFKIEKNKLGRKYQNIDYNLIEIRDIHYSIDQADFHVAQFNINTYLNELERYFNNNKEKIDEMIQLYIYYNKCDDIFSSIKDKYNINADYMFLSSNKYKHDYSYVISLHKYTNYASITIYKDSIKNGENVLDIDILDDDNTSLVIDFISKEIELGLNNYNKYLKAEERRKKREQKKLLKDIKEDQQLFHEKLIKITNVFDNNKDKIIEYNIEFVLDDQYVNLLYFKDYRGIEFIIHHKNDYIHKIDSIKKSYNNRFYNYSNYKFIEVDFSLEEDIYITEIDNTYKIKSYIEENDYPKYQLPIYLNNPKINLSFRYMGYGTKDKTRYDFIKATSKINNILKRISDIKYNYIDDFYKTYNNKIYISPIFIDESINEEIYKSIYPIICLADEKPDEILNIRLSTHFTINSGNETCPWLIKNFIEALRNIGVKNIHNII